MTITPAAGQSGQATIFVTVSDGVRTASNSFVLTVESTVPDFGSWIGNYPGLSDPAPDADPDGDGLPNLVEYFMALSPAEGSAGAMPIHSATPGVIGMDYRRGKATHGVVGGMKWRSNLSDVAGWSAENVTYQLLSDHGDYEMWRATVPVLPGEQQKFLRLEMRQQ
jgi:hypothetical protein